MVEQGDTNIFCGLIPTISQEIILADSKRCALNSWMQPITFGWLLVIVNWAIQFDDDDAQLNNYEHLK